MRSDLIPCKIVWRLAQTFLQALNQSYAEYSLAASIDRGVLNPATWGRSPEADLGDEEIFGPRKEEGRIVSDI